MNTTMVSSVLDIKKLQQNKSILPTKIIPIISTSQKVTKQTLQDSCMDSDGGIAYWVKWTITTVISGITRVEEDSCNSDGSLREWFCGNPGEAAGLLRSDNYVACWNGNACYQGACKNCSAPEIVLACSLQLSSCPSNCSASWTGDAIIQDMYILPDNTPTMLSTTYDNQINLVIKNIWSWMLNIPINTTYNNTNRFSLKCNGPWGLDYFVTTSTIQSQILPNESITTQIDAWPYSNDFHWRYATPGAKSITCTLMSHPNPINTPPDPNN